MIENLNDKWLAAAGLLGLLLYLSWLYFLLARFRPWLAFQLSKILNATIVDSHGYKRRGHGWIIIKGGTWWKTILLFMIEIVFLIGGGLGPFAVIFGWLLFIT